MKPFQSLKSRIAPASFQIFILALLLSLPTIGGAVVLDWDSVTWTPGALSGSFEIDPSNPGADVTIAITGTTSFKPFYPAITTQLTGGITPAEKSLELFMDFFRNTDVITVTITFNYAAGVDQANFDLFDIDRDGNHYVDQISAIQARAFGGAYFGGTITGSSKNTVAGSGTGQTITANALSSDTTGDGNATIDFGSKVLTEMTFTYGNDSSKAGANLNPAQQSVALYDIAFQPRPVPEVNPALAAVALCGIAVGFRTYRRRHRTDPLAPRGDCV
jgi:hypothetical protein